MQSSNAQVERMTWFSAFAEFLLPSELLKVTIVSPIINDMQYYSFNRFIALRTFETTCFLNALVDKI